jgi:hypothetical protein
VLAEISQRRDLLYSSRLVRQKDLTRLAPIRAEHGQSGHRIAQQHEAASTGTKADLRCSTSHTNAKGHDTDLRPLIAGPSELPGSGGGALDIRH